MLSEEEKKQVVEQLRTEEQTRKELNEAREPHKFAWVDNKLFLLIVGFVLTGILVPLFQFTQGTITWKRQNRYDNVKYRLTMMREGMTEFVQLWAVTVQTYQRLQPFIEASTLSGDAFQKFQTECTDWENRSVGQSAKVASLLIHFAHNDNEGDLSGQFNEFLRQRTLFVELVKKKVSAKANASAEQSTDPERMLGDLDASYQAIVQKMKEQIERMEDESNRFM